MSRYLLSISVLFLLHATISAQQNPAKKPFVLAVREIATAYSKEVNFVKAEYFFSRNEPDSTLFYSMKQLDAVSAKELYPYCHFLRGLSFKKKSCLKLPKLNLLP